MFTVVYKIVSIGFLFIMFDICRSLYYYITSLNTTKTNTNNPSKEVIDKLNVKKAILFDELDRINRINDTTSKPIINIRVRRKNIIEDSYQCITPWFGKSRLQYSRTKIEFIGEDGLDAGGLTREWFIEISKQLYNDDSLQLFVFSDNDNTTLLINTLYNLQPFSIFNIFKSKSNDLIPVNLKYYKLIGMIIGKAIYESQLMHCYFSNSFYKNILCKEIDFEDFEQEDPVYYKSLISLLDYDLSTMDLGLTFSMEQQLADGKIHEIELITNGKKINVSNENKFQYITAVIKYKLVTRYEPFINAIKSGINEIIPLDLLLPFTVQEFDILLNGLPSIDINDWKRNTIYDNYNSYSLTIIYFWRIVISFTEIEKQKLLQFVTGSSRVPPNGFAELRGSNGYQKFTIRYLDTKNDNKNSIRLPKARTCFNILELPNYETYDIQRAMLLRAINESDNFGQI